MSKAEDNQQLIVRAIKTLADAPRHPGGTRTVAEAMQILEKGLGRPDRDRLLALSGEEMLQALAVGSIVDVLLGLEKRSAEKRRQW